MVWDPDRSVQKKKKKKKKKEKKKKEESEGLLFEWDERVRSSLFPNSFSHLVGFEVMTVMKEGNQRIHQEAKMEKREECGLVFVDGASIHLSWLQNVWRIQRKIFWSKAPSETIQR